jgi:hypothetical protein
MMIWISRGQSVQAADQIVLRVYFDLAKHPACVYVNLVAMMVSGG